MGFLTILVSVVILVASYGVTKMHLDFSKKKILFYIALGLLCSIMCYQKFSEPDLELPVK